MDYIFGRLFGRILRSNNYRLSLYLRMKHSLSSLPWVFGPALDSFRWQNSSFWMSKSGSPSPPRKITLPSTPKTNSPNERAFTNRSGSEKSPSLARNERKSVEPPNQRRSPDVEHHTPESTTRRRRRVAEEQPSEEPMAKRLRTESPSVSHRSKNQSSPESDSQADMADTEMEAKATDANDQAPPAPPPKKKRTRTLTTPHQSAVLHALLAQSRFPTTAMREEVGRSIGLSARKVQIWFQNQRQKARKPRNQSDSGRPPQYGPFQNIGEPSSVHRFQNYGPSRPHYAGRSPPEAPSGSSEPPLRLLGPGMPGAPAPYPVQGYRPSPSPNHVESPFPQGYQFPSTSGPNSYHRAPPPTSRHSLSPRINWRDRGRDPSRTLPPLLPTRPSSSNPLPSFWGHLDMPQPAPEQRFSAHRSESSRRTPSNIPPPFTLQPSPQWDETSYLPRPNSWSRQHSSHSARPRSMSPMAPRRYPNTRHAAERGVSPVPSEPSHSRAIPRSGRYDPIRSTFVPYSPNPATPPMMTHDCRPQGGQANRDDRPLSPSH